MSFHIRKGATILGISLAQISGCNPRTLSIQVCWISLRLCYGHNQRRRSLPRGSADGTRPPQQLNENFYDLCFSHACILLRENAW